LLSPFAFLPFTFYFLNMSIATKTGDKGNTALIGGERVSKADFRVETYGTIDELSAALGFARSICGDEEINELTKKIQRELFFSRRFCCQSAFRRRAAALRDARND